MDCRNPQLSVELLDNSGDNETSLRVGIAITLLHHVCYNVRLFNRKKDLAIRNFGIKGLMMIQYF